MAPRALLSRLRLAPLLHHHHLGRFLSAATPPPDESPPGALPPPPSNSRLFVAGLSWSTDERSLQDAFSSFGTVTEDSARGRCSTECRGGHQSLDRAQPREHFGEMPARYVVACWSTIYRHTRSGSFHEAIVLFTHMMRGLVCAQTRSPWSVCCLRWLGWVTPCLLSVSMGGLLRVCWNPIFLLRPRWLMRMRNAGAP